MCQSECPPPNERMGIQARKKIESVQEESQRLVNGDRNDFYGDPLKAYEKHAEIFNAINPRGFRMDALDMMYALKAIKMGREFYRHKRDNLVDEVSMNDFIDRWHDKDMSPLKDCPEK